MGRFLDKFPKIPYDINRGLYSNFDSVTDLTFRFSIIKDTLNNISSYYEYVIKDDETPEILADKVYGDPEAYWIILYANDIYDPQYDWPMNQNVFEKYLAGKYGSVSAAKSQIHHYEKVLVRQVDSSESNYVYRKTVDYDAQTMLTCTLEPNANTSSVYSSQLVFQKNVVTDTTIFEGYVSEFDSTNNIVKLFTTSGKLTNFVALQDFVTFDNMGIVIENNQESDEYYLNLPSTPQYSTYVINNKRIVEGVTRAAISCYDHEVEMNENKRFIKVIKKDYYPQIISEFNNLIKDKPRNFRRLAK